MRASPTDSATNVFCRVWTQLLDRKQQRTAIIYIPLSKFDVVVSERTSNPTTGNCSETDVEMRDPSHPVSQQNGLKILYEETSDIWINVKLLL